MKQCNSHGFWWSFVCIDLRAALRSCTCYSRRCSMKYGIYHQTLFSASLQPNAFCGFRIPDTEVHIPVVFVRGFPNRPDNNDFPQKQFELRHSLVSLNSAAVWFCICLYNSNISCKPASSAEGLWVAASFPRQTPWDILGQQPRPMRGLTWGNVQYAAS